MPKDVFYYPGEIEALKSLKEIGGKYGYGNCIQHLKKWWAEHLIESGLDKNTAENHVELH